VFQKYLKVSLVIGVFLFAGFVLVKPVKADVEFYEASSTMFQARCPNENCLALGGAYNNPASSTIFYGLGNNILTSIQYHGCLDDSGNNHANEPLPIITITDVSTGLVIATSSPGGGYCAPIHWDFSPIVLPDAFYLNYLVNSSYGYGFYQGATNVYYSDFSFMSGENISIYRPLDNSTTTNEANSGNFWGASVSNSSLSCSYQTPCSFNIYYYPTLESAPIYSDTYFLFSTSSYQVFDFPKGAVLDFNTEYSAQAYLYGTSTDNLIATSTIIHFTIETSTPPVQGQGFIMDSIIGLKNILFQKIPLGWLSLIIQKLNEISVSSSTPPALALTVSFGDGTSTLSFLNFTSTKDLAGPSGMTLIRTYAEYGIWIGFLIYLISVASSFFTARGAFKDTDSLSGV
jgi:hypothetical protein